MSTPGEIVESLKTHLGKTHSYVEIEYEITAGISHPIAVTISQNGADLGTINGDENATILSVVERITGDASRTFRKLIQSSER